MQAPAPTQPIRLDRAAISGRCHRVEALPGLVPMLRSPVGLHA